MTYGQAIADLEDYMNHYIVLTEEWYNTVADALVACREMGLVHDYPAGT